MPRGGESSAWLGLQQQQQQQQQVRAVAVRARSLSVAWSAIGASAVAFPPRLKACS